MRLLLRSLCFYSITSATLAQSVSPYHEGLRFIQEKRWQEAKTKFEQYLTSRPHDIETLSNLGYATYELNELEIALRYLNQALELDSLHVTVQFRRGLVHLKQGSYRLALADFEKVKSRSPSFGEGWTEFNLGVANMELRDWKSAIPSFESARRSNPTQFDSYVYSYRNLGFCHLRLGQFGEAIKIYSDGLQRFPEDEWLLEMLGWSYQASGEKDKSVPLLERSATLGFAKLPASRTVIMSTPFNGKWQVAQGNNTKYTHLGLLGRYSWDFVSMHEDGTIFTAGGARNEDYFSFGKEILSPGDGIISEVQTAVPDNEPNTTNWLQPWGNYVVIKHGESVYSVLAHLKEGSVVVRQGQRIDKGEKIGLCGNSGNSSQSHLHFHVSYGDEHHSSSRPSKFQDYYTVKDGKEYFVKEGIPERGEVMRR